jgi:hypothetical protein
MLRMLLSHDSGPRRSYRDSVNRSLRCNANLLANVSLEDAQDVRASILGLVMICHCLNYLQRKRYRRATKKKKKKKKKKESGMHEKMHHAT